jgi:hypothetical protein
MWRAPALRPTVESGQSAIFAAKTEGSMTNVNFAAF